MKLEIYNEIISIIREYDGAKVCPWREVDSILKQRFPDVSADTLGSIYSLEYQKKMKKNHQKFSKTGEKLYKKYQKEADSGEKPGILLRLADSIDLSPALLARIILEQHQEQGSDEEEVCFPTIHHNRLQLPVQIRIVCSAQQILWNCSPQDHKLPSASKNTITKLMRDTTLIKNKDLAYEVYLCVIHDDQYGPVTDCIKHSIGQEYELRLQRMVRNANIPFKDEEQLRTCGYDKTPDVKLELPMAVDGFVVNWIESKALFGDEANHKTYIKEQYLSYWNRFGPGLVIYWLGFVDTLEYISEKRFIIRDTFPNNITLMDPKSI
ncbi:CDAN1-interacting nuclease 1 isoform X1 [Schistocerca serialis cubense]|uniref:CDAN1-interacting nuclease 1 isoform X1 n=1 Tax=Schistocerca serialis cubense TaxID=2023355 RepID=UPI00214DF842|nr:CDAN1-interacting nuclease 1 isoform X1 [Schistocerca serialis cubense]XP_049962253.1 CDAN1-interacting nuclease 1 isoform X1 [Schistocerca serialis cubense]XP_049962254.1 CDAN1-interacting nuclease 1 isoform X1 [Schistocerca serialis cubense]